MDIALGIDTGGTYTDAVLVDHSTGQVLASAKALTTRHDLAIGIREAIAAVFACQDGPLDPISPANVVLVGLSTTLATNAMVEGQGGPVCLLLIGYDPELMVRYDFQRELGTTDFVYVAGGHNGAGEEAAPLDEDAIRAAVLARRDTVEAFAVSGYFSVRNPEHELRARVLISEHAGLPVTCGHQLSSRLNAVRRATTAALNASLIAPLRELIGTVRRTLDEQGMRAPLMVVKGDGSLVRSEWAMLRPIETILSGPAASVVGAWHLAGRRDAWVVDVGGTTTDIAALRDGWPTLNAEGARVGGWRTMVQAIDVYTTGLGGDSHVRLDEDGRLCIGPRRVVPLSWLGASHPEAAAELCRQADDPDVALQDPAEFVMTWRPPASRLTDDEQEMLRQLAAGPRSMARLVNGARRTRSVRSRVDDLAARGLLQRSAFTPTDALHVLGRFVPWDEAAARLGARLLARRAGLGAEEFSEQVVAALADRVAAALVGKVLEDETGRPCVWQQEPLAAEFLARAMRSGDERGAGLPASLVAKEPIPRPLPDRQKEATGPDPSGQGDGSRTSRPGAFSSRERGQDLACALTLRRPIVAIGAPVAAYMPQVAERLHTELVIPPHAEVANAVGAVAGGVIQRVPVLITHLSGGSDTLRLFLPNGCHDFLDLEEAVAHACQIMVPYAEGLARQAGAEHVEVQVEREDHWTRINGLGGGRLYLDTDLVFTAAGRPAAVKEVSVED
jgi:N-methylhydantoinase A/oxoprolinase/acetone carboxylase beta subunit